MKKIGITIIVLFLIGIIVMSILSLDYFKPTYIIYMSDDLGIVTTKEIKAKNDEEAYISAASHFFTNNSMVKDYPESHLIKKVKFDVKKEGDNEFLSKTLSKDFQKRIVNSMK